MSEMRATEETDSIIDNPDIPGTGENDALFVWLFILILSASGLTISVLMWLKKRQE